MLMPRPMATNTSRISFARMPQNDLCFVMRGGLTNAGQNAMQKFRALRLRELLEDAQQAPVMNR